MRPYYEDEAVQLFNCDCRELLPHMQGVDHVITDPPYSRDLYLNFRTNKGSRDFDDGKARREMQNGSIGSIDDMLEDVAHEFARLARRWTIVFHDAEIGSRWRAAFGDLYVRAGVWVKPNAVPQISGDRPGQGFESITIAHAPGRKRWNGGGRPAVWTYFAVNSQAAYRLSAGHPCPKPEPLMAQLIAQFTDPDEVILDAFAGSGTTLAVAKRLGRRAIGVEISEAFCEITVKRLSQGALELGYAVGAVDPHANRTGTPNTRDLDFDVRE